MLTLLDLAAVGLLGTLSGALLAEGIVLVPYWRALQPAEFTDLHHGFAPRLYRFFAPLTALAVTVAIGESMSENPLPQRGLACVPSPWAIETMNGFAESTTYRFTPRAILAIVLSARGLIGHAWPWNFAHSFASS